MYIPELLSPVGDLECLKAAVQNGANAVYLGASLFSARAKAANFNDEELANAINYARSRNVAVHLALNTLIKDEEFEDAVKLAVRAYNLGIDAIIIQDLGLAKYLHKNYPEITLHGSTQMTVHNLEGVLQLQEFGYSRVVLSRELSIKDIEYIRKNTSIELEVFIHGALCISYSGQCLLSSMIGGRSGNRGLCAQPCRLKYDLIKEQNGNEITIDKGYLMSPRDNLGIEHLPELIKMGINSFKIEGRMKTPYYVGVVTRTYRKYIDLTMENSSLPIEEQKQILDKSINTKNESTGLTDKEELMQVFNRGNFSTGHFKPTPNKNLIFKEKPNNMGFYIGNITHVNENKGHITLKLEDTISIGDRISINNESYTVSELMINNNNYQIQNKGAIVKLGRMKGDIRVGAKVYRIETAKLNASILPTFKEEKEFKKVKINTSIKIKNNEKIEMSVFANDTLYNNISCNYVSEAIPDKAINKAIDKEFVAKQINKTGSTQYEFENIEIILDDGLFVPSGVLNDIRRNALDLFYNTFINSFKHNESVKDIIYPTLDKSINDNESYTLLINILNENANYSELDDVDSIYIPLKYFINPKYEKTIRSFNNPIYCYMPHIIKDELLNKIDFKNIISKYNVNGFVVSHISQIRYLKDYNLKLIGNYNLNVYNSFSIHELNSLGLYKINISPELTKDETNSLIEKSKTNYETIFYGKLPVMTNGYCYLGCSNKCYPDCSKQCLLNAKYYLKDRMNMKFRIVPDNTSTITTVYNSKTLSVTKDTINSLNKRIDVLDESIIEINEIILNLKSNNRFEGKSYTNGNY